VIAPPGVAVEQERPEPERHGKGVQDRANRKFERGPPSNHGGDAESSHRTSTRETRHRPSECPRTVVWRRSLPLPSYAADDDPVSFRLGVGLVGYCRVVDVAAIAFVRLTGASRSKRPGRVATLVHSEGVAAARHGAVIIFPAGHRAPLESGGL